MYLAARAEPRAADGRFAPGHSRNPAGRPKGARNRATLIAEALVEESAIGLGQEGIQPSPAGGGGSKRPACIRPVFS